jgi:hypothetical protein
MKLHDSARLARAALLGVISELTNAPLSGYEEFDSFRREAEAALAALTVLCEPGFIDPQEKLRRLHG